MSKSLRLPSQRGATVSVERTHFGAALLTGRRVLAVGRISRPCRDCRDFHTVMVRGVNGQLVAAHCPTCVTVPQQQSGR